jgi:hypothetical protein
MKIAVMQPYFFPYLGYFQLIDAVDTFICMDDTTFIKKGWIHRNRLFFNSEPRLFTVPVHNASQNRQIRETALSLNEFQHWKRKFFRMLEHFYKKTSYYHIGVDLVMQVLEQDVDNIADLARTAIVACCRLLHLNTDFESTSSIYGNSDLQGIVRIIDICKQSRAATYINPPGGQHMYSKNCFAEHNITLQFIQPHLSSYTVGKTVHIPGLSILDMIMCCGPDMIRNVLLPEYSLT